MSVGGQIFIDSEIPLPAWLQTHSVDNLEKRLAGMVLTVLSVIFLTATLQWQGGQDILSLDEPVHVG